MTNIIAGIDSQNNVRMELVILGLYKSIPYGGIIDTGFSGGLVMPLVTAVELGLTKTGASTVTLADGSVNVVPTFLCQVKIGGVTQDATTLIMGNEVLVGMELMTPFKFTMISKTGSVELIEWDSDENFNQLAETLRRLGG
ncbi:MAG: hypothetical protein E4G94_00615 [ANME-2 cluster archaeon]|nr:MAG: hypothetical protein E4G94_00615 [ANME-2 cluster archaeon]